MEIGQAVRITAVAPGVEHGLVDDPPGVPVASATHVTVLAWSVLHQGGDLGGQLGQAGGSGRPALAPATPG